MKTSAFMHEETYEDDRLQQENKVDNEVKADYMTNVWEWKHLVDLFDEDEIKGQPKDDHYDGPHGLIPGVEN